MEAISTAGGGSIVFIKENSPTSFEVEQRLQTMVGARNMVPGEPSICGWCTAFVIFTDDLELHWIGRTGAYSRMTVEVASKTDVTFVVANNHNLGKAAVNALELMSMLEGLKVRTPASLVSRYPELEPISTS